MNSPSPNPIPISWNIYPPIKPNIVSKASAKAKVHNYIGLYRDGRYTIYFIGNDRKRAQ